MSALALTLVLASAVIHATWNLVAKRAGGGVAFLWLFAVVSVVAYAPVILFLALTERVSLGASELTVLAVSSAFHLAYIFSLQRGYAVADLSLVYPLARGTGPLLASAGAIVALGERPTAVAGIGIVTVSGGVFIMTSAAHKPTSRLDAGVMIALVTGVFIAGYTLADKYAVDNLAINPVVVVWTEEAVRSLVFLPVVLARRPALADVFRRTARDALAVGLLGPLSYILVLTALSLSPASYVAPAREIAIVVGVLFGIRYLGEPRSRRRLVGGAVIALGVFCLAIG